MKMKQLEYLIKIAECGSISKAAQELYISQPSLTKAISSLEDEWPESPQSALAQTNACGRSGARL